MIRTLINELPSFPCAQNINSSLVLTEEEELNLTD